MRNKLIFLLLCLTLISCSNEQKEFSLKGKWVILSFTKEGKEVIDEIYTEIPTLSYYLYEKKSYPAIRFKDSLLIFPGTNDQQLKFLVEGNKDLSSLKISKLKEMNYDSLSPFIQNSLLRTFKITKDYKNRELVLKSEAEEIRIIEAETFAKKVKSMFLD